MGHVAAHAKADPAGAMGAAAGALIGGNVGHAVGNAAHAVGGAAGHAVANARANPAGAMGAAAGAAMGLVGGPLGMMAGAALGGKAGGAVGAKGARATDAHHDWIQKVLGTDMRAALGGAALAGPVGAAVGLMAAERGSHAGIGPAGAHPGMPHLSAAGAPDMLTEVAQRTASTATGDARSLAISAAKSRALNLVRGAVGGAAEQAGTAKQAIMSGAGKAVASEAGAFAMEAERHILSPATAAKGAGAIAGVIGAGTAVWNDSDKVRDHKMTAAHATADVVVKGGEAMAAGASGAALGAALGSIVPGAGTLIGGAAGFVGGVAGSVIANEIAERSGALRAATDGLEHMLQGREKSLQEGWQTVAKGKDAVTHAAGEALHGVESFLSDHNPFASHDHKE